ncbi:hypothetical protein DID88_004006 [Monilinia fructigena]|uniref:Reverse transcriptase domain-containing protein n=1 Tax=Monilinia fructigena TaxID=38457 RepID=A0A395IDR5_9HELO|nr:hypothetical protein DID88_004006 [Monilinia fructigena]
MPLQSFDIGGHQCGISGYRDQEHHALGNSEQDRLCSGEAGDDSPHQKERLAGPRLCGLPGSRHTTNHHLTKKGDQPALRWLGVWFDRRLTFKRHVAERAGKARQIARHIRGLAKTVDGPPASALRKAVITCVIPSLTYGTEAWYAGRTKPPRLLRSGRSTTVSARVGWHIDTLDKTLSLAVRGVLPVWRTTPTVTLYRDAGIPSAEAMLEEAKLRFALRIQTVDEAHPLVRRITPPLSPAAEARAQVRWPRPRSRDWGPIPTGPQAYSQAFILHARLSYGPHRWSGQRNGCGCL